MNQMHKSGGSKSRKIDYKIISVYIISLIRSHDQVTIKSNYHGTAIDLQLMTSYDAS